MRVTWANHVCERQTLEVPKMFCMVLSDSPQRGHFTEVLERFQTKCEILLSGSQREIPVVLVIKCLYRKDLFFLLNMKF